MQKKNGMKSPEDGFGESKVTNIKLCLQKGTQFMFEKALCMGVGEREETQQFGLLSLQNKTPNFS